MIRRQDGKFEVGPETVPRRCQSVRLFRVERLSIDSCLDEGFFGAVIDDPSTADVSVPPRCIAEFHKRAVALPEHLAQFFASNSCDD